MATTTHSRIVEQLKALAAHLTARREALVQAWEKAVQDDAELTTSDSLSVLHFRDLIPKVLESFEDRLSATGVDEAVIASEEHERVIELDVDSQEIEAHFARLGDVLAQCRGSACRVNPLGMVGLVKRTAQINWLVVQT